MTKTTETNIVTITPEQLAVYRSETQDIINRLGSTGGGDVIKLRDNTFIFPDGQEIHDEMDAIIVDFAYVNAMYQGRWDPKNPSSPVCGSVGITPKGMVPSSAAPKKQAESCDQCPNNQYGSNGSAKACKNEVWLAVIAANATDSSQIYVMKLAPTAITPFNKYAKAQMTAFDRPLYGVITHFEFDKTQTYTKILCSNPDRKMNDNIELAKRRVPEASARLAQGVNFGV